METLLSLTITAEDLERFVKILSRDDTFTVLYLLTKAKSPSTLENLCRQYGASATEMRDRLERLSRLDLITRRGRGYVAAREAVVAMKSLEERLGKSDLPMASVMAAPATVIEPMYVPGEIYSAPLAEARTNNGTSLSVIVTATASSESNVPPTKANPVNEDNIASVESLPEQPNATRSQLYM
jgi:DNA-binding Lrp family transcriptional regulator